jgi:hypothetical protein
MKLLNLKTLSKEYSISVFTFRKFVKMGLPHYRVGRKILVNPDDFEEWFEKYKINSISAHYGLNRIMEDNLSEIE